MLASVHPARVACRQLVSFSVLLKPFHPSCVLQPWSVVGSSFLLICAHLNSSGPLTCGDLGWCGFISYKSLVFA